jgi:EAL domain-containing protein (putative c-di-GMP-specific phosphodiesterase class I)
MHEAFADYDLASKIGDIMKRDVISTIARWQASGWEVPRISINASPAEFLRDDYAERLLDLLQKHSIPGPALEIEVTEHVFLGRSAEYVARALVVLKSAGVHLSLDDFGTGYSSLSHLRDLPIDTVKIDRSFIEKIEVDQEAGAIVAAIVSLAKSLGLTVVAEGIETPSQAELLRVLGCDFGQGYLYGAAVEAQVASQMLKRSAVAA